jgi:hypothetical protein
MGGGSGGSLSSEDLKRLEERAKQRLAEAASDTRRHVFISFAREDLNEVNLLRGQAKNDKTELEFDDYSVKEPFDSANAEYIRSQIRQRIARCSVTVVFLTEESASSRWVNWEIEESLKRGKGVIGVYRGERPPASLPTAFTAAGCRPVPWSHESLMTAIEQACAEKT